MFGKKKELPKVTSIRCSESGCGFRCNDPVTLKKHTDWKHKKERSE